MRTTIEILTETLIQRLEAAGPLPQRYVSEAFEVIVFGSMPVGVDRPDSDIDVLCVGDCEYKLKTDRLDLIVVPREKTKSGTWLQSELASHVVEYGVWIKGLPRWKGHVRVGPIAINEKRRRVRAFMGSLSSSWLKLEECFRAKYAVKLRRETQRLILLENGMPVPPTAILDGSWSSIPKSPKDVCDRLRQLASNADASFVDNLLARIEAHFRLNSAER